MNTSEILLIDKLRVLVSYIYFPSELTQEGFYITNQVSNITIDSILEGSLDSLLLYVDSKFGGFYEELETKILESYD